jgi:hypothetical protein
MERGERVTKPARCNCACGCTKEFNLAELDYYRDLDSDVDTVLCHDCAVREDVEDPSPDVPTYNDLRYLT